MFKDLQILTLATKYQKMPAYASTIFITTIRKEPIWRSTKLPTKTESESLIAEKYAAFWAHLLFTHRKISSTLLSHWQCIWNRSISVYMAIQFSSKSKPNLRFPYKSTIAVYKDDHLIKVMGSREGAVYPPLLADLIKNQSHQIIAQKNTGNYVLVSLIYKGFIVWFLPLLTLFISLTGIMVSSFGFTQFLFPFYWWSLSPEFQYEEIAQEQIPNHHNRIWCCFHLYSSEVQQPFIINVYTI